MECHTSLKDTSFPSVLIFAGSLFSVTKFRLPLIKFLQQSGFNVSVAYWGDGVPCSSIAGVNWFPLGSDHHSINLFNNLNAFSRLSRLLIEKKFNIILMSSAKPIIFGLFFSHFFSRKSKKIILLEGLGAGFSFLNKTGSHFKKFVFKVITRGANSWIFLNNFNMNLIKLIHGISGEINCHVINGLGVDLDKFVPGDFSTRFERKKVVFVGRAISKKGIYEFVNIAKVSRERNINFDFQIACAPSIDQDVKKSEMSDWLRLGVVSCCEEKTDVASFLKDSFALIFCSQYEEGFPTVIMEAQACGVPCLVCNDVKNEGLVIEGITGFSFERGSPDNCIDKLSILNDKEIFRQLSSSARLHAVENFDVRSRLPTFKRILLSR